jgi:hypothetical protein
MFLCKECLDKRGVFGLMVSRGPCEDCGETRSCADVKPPRVFLNDKPFEHICSNGTKFRCERCDFTKTIFYSNEPHEGICQTDEVRLMVDVAEMIGFHATNIHPQLNGFSGYDCITFECCFEEIDG